MCVEHNTLDNETILLMISMKGMFMGEISNVEIQFLKKTLIWSY